MRTRGWLIAAAFFLLLLSPARAADSLPDLRPYQPSGWSAPIVLSTVIGASTDACPIPAGNLYLDFAIVNYSAVAVSNQPFLVRLSVDGTTVQDWTVNSMGGLTYIPLNDYPLSLTAGTHTVSMDPLNVLT